jgi:two-component system sensor histidine kinase RpfC
MLSVEGVRHVLRRLRNREDSEHEQAFTRLIVVPGMLVYMWAAPHGSEDRGAILFASFIIFLLGFVASLGLIAHIIIFPRINPVRRVISMLVDVAGVAGTMAVGGATASVFFPLLLWITLGHGFRYGRPYLFGAAATSIVAFTLVLILNPDWHSMTQIGIGLLVSLFLLPAYFAVLLSKLTDAIRRAEEASRAKSHFLAAVSHEFRTPLNAVIGMSDILRTTPLNHDQADMVATVRTAATGLLGLLNSVLDLAKLEARRFSIDEEPFDLLQMLAGVRHMLLHGAAQKGLYLRLRLPPSTPTRLQGDPRAIQQILINLIGNAIKFTEQGGIMLEVIPLEAAPGEARLRIEVRDTGIGLSSEAQAKIFERFAQADETRRRVMGGTGLGLSIASELIELMHGSIGVRSQQGVGSCFWLELPLPLAPPNGEPDELPRAEVVVLGSRASALNAVARLDRLGMKGRAVATAEAARQLMRRDPPPRMLLVTAHDPPVDIAALADDLPRTAGTEPVDVLTLAAGGMPLPDVTLADLSADATDADLLVCLRAALQSPAGSRPAETEMPRPLLRQLRILVAEDNRTNQKVIERLLEHAGHRVELAGDGQAAIDALETGTFDVVLMDINMPDMDGIETVKLLRFIHPAHTLPPIIALSADATPDTKAACEAVGFSGYLTKPIDTTILLDHLERITAAPGTAEQPVAPPAALEERTPGERAGPVLDDAKLASLARLDNGDGFLAQVIDEFIEDAAGIVERIAAAAAAGDAHTFRDEAHALRSSAGYVGATALFNLCVTWRNLDDDALILRGRAEVAGLRHEFARLRAALTAARPRDAASSESP